MGFLSRNFVEIIFLNAGGHLEFWEKWKNIRRLVSRVTSMPNFIQIWWTRSKSRAEMWFVESNLADFGPMTAGGHLGFWEKSKLFHGLVLMVKDHVHARFCLNLINGIQLPSQNVTSYLHPLSPASLCDKAVHRAFLWEFKTWKCRIFQYVFSGNFALNEQFLYRLVCRIKQYVHAKFCPNLMNEIQMPSHNVICSVKFGRFLDHLGFCDEWEILAELVCRVKK